MKKILLMLVVVFVVSGCAMTLKPDFPIGVKEDIKVTPIVYNRADWIQGVYGYQTYIEAFVSQNIQKMMGALVAGDEKIAFVRFDKQIGKYDSIFELRYPDIKDVRVFRQAEERRLVLKAEKDFYTFEIVKEMEIDRIQTYKFAIFIANKLGKDSSGFSKELEELEKKSEK
jgi:hypothetical protein